MISFICGVIVLLITRWLLKMSIKSNLTQNYWLAVKLTSLKLCALKGVSQSKKREPPTNLVVSQFIE